MLLWQQRSGPPIVEATVFGTGKSVAAGDFAATPEPWSYQRRALDNVRDLPYSTLFLRPAAHSSGVVVVDLCSRVWVTGGAVRWWKVGVCVWEGRPSWPPLSWLALS